MVKHSDHIDLYNSRLINSDCHKADVLNNIRLFIPFAETVTTNKLCACNEYVALHDRHLQVNEHRLSSNEMSMVKKAYSYVWKDYPPVSLQQYTTHRVVTEKPPSKRKLYQQAAISLITKPLNQKDLKISMFIKNERMSDPNKAPRCIQAYTPRYNVLFQTYLRPIERHFKNMGFDTVMTTKGMDQYQQARLLVSQSLRFNQPIYILADHSRFDSRQHTQWLIEEAKYNIAYFDNDSTFSNLYQSQIGRKYGTSRNGTRYQVTGTRMSGAPNTSHGNCTTNYAILSYWLGECGIQQSRIIVNGDDSVIIIEATDKERVDPSLLNALGFGTTYTIVDELPKVSFCQTNPIQTINGPLMVRDPLRVITRATVCIDKSVNDSDFLNWLHTVGQCEESQNMGVPILQSFSRFLTRCGNKTIAIKDDMQQRKLHTEGLDSQITNRARMDFYCAFAITPTQQRLYEQYFENLTVPKSVKRVFEPTQTQRIWMESRIY